MKSAKRLIALLAIFSMSSVGISYAAGSSANEIASFFLGSQQTGGASLNQVLALLVGPSGKPGPAGVAGKDGFVGMNGQDGKNGLDGAPGPVGPAGPIGPQGPAGKDGANGKDGAPGRPGTNGSNGANVVAVTLGVGDARCAQGGTKFTDATGMVTYACNGSGGTSSSSGVLSNGVVSLGTCDSALNLALNQRFTGTDFLLNNVTLTGLSDACVGVTIKVSLPIKATGTLVRGGYANGDVIECVVGPTTLSMLPNGANNTFVISDAVTGSIPAAVCTKGGSAFGGVSAISAQDLGNNVAISMGN
ncbi:MAG: hypothetical protein RL414_537 [Actinomycetota bacterium]|jgi:hypothetical protein